MRVFKAFAILLAVISPLLMTGCGGGGGGGGSTSSVSAPTSSGTTLSGSSTAKTLIAQSIAGNYSSLQDNAAKYAKRAGSLRSIRPEITSESAGFGKVQINYGPSDTLTAFGTTYTYIGGRQILSFFDTSNNYTETLEQVNTLSIDNQSLAYRFVTGGSIVSVVASGKLAFSGFLSETSFTVQAIGLLLTGSIGSADTFSWTMNG
ncbi:MAG TPA: hypothetical protein PKM25_14925, partial [Candidatus Ozemobacteraceae bacterium]|nr:hypothetical protein [Candidatus Ozemobacteraceae bacterium]